MYFASYIQQKRGVVIYKNSNSIHTDIYCGIPATEKTLVFKPCSHTSGLESELEVLNPCKEFAKPTDLLHKNTSMF